MEQRQHAVIRMELLIRFKKRYFYKGPIESGTEINYNIEQEKNNLNY